MARILIVDDAVFLRRSMRAAIEAAGHEVVGEAANGAEALVAVDATQPDVVLLDINMPEMNGNEALSILRERHPDVRVLICSALAEGPQVDLARSLGATQFLRKPYEPEDLVSALLISLSEPAFR